MKALDKKTFQQLAGVHAPHCVSLFLPTRPSGPEVVEGQARIRLRNQLKEVRDELAGRGLTSREIGQLLAPAGELADDGGFWRRLSDGLALFLSDGHFEYFTLPVEVPYRTYVADHYYLLPILPFFSGDGRFFLLELNLEDINCYVGGRDHLTEIRIEDLAPEAMEEVVGSDYEQKFLNFRTGQATGGGGGGAVFHGHGEGKDDRKQEAAEFLQAVDRGLRNILQEESAPLLLYGVTYLVGIYREVNHYRYLLDDYIKGSPGQDDLNQLHAKAWTVVGPLFEKERQDKAAQFQELYATERTAYDLEDVMSAAIGGRVDTLFVREGAEVFGTYDPSADRVKTAETQTLANASLVNLAAVRTFLQGGQVYLLPRSDMPVETAELNALLRY